MTEVTQADTPLTTEQVASYNPDPVEQVDGVEVSTSSLDGDGRQWLSVTDSNGHTLIVEAHEGGSRAHCDKCGEWVDYGGYVHTPEQDALKAARLAEARALVAEADGETSPAPDVEVSHGDAAVSASGTSA